MSLETKSAASAAPFEHCRAFDRRGAAKYLREVWGLRVSVSTLAKQAVFGTGPRFFNPSASTVIYLRDDLDDWARERLGAPVRSTTEWAQRQHREGR